MIRRWICRALVFSGADRCFRFVNRRKLLVVMYHGVTTCRHDPPVWTQLPVETFRRQLRFLKRHYRSVTLSHLIGAIRGDRELPERAALVTFDDGLKNNFEVAFPILRDLGIPAAIFLTVGAIGTGRPLWFDECYLLLREGARRGRDSPSSTTRPGALRSRADVGCLLRIGRDAEAGRRRPQERGDRSAPCRGAAGRPRRLLGLRAPGLGRGPADAALGVVEFGVHTASHRILSELTMDEWQDEVVAPKRELEARLGVEAGAFCFPNGRPGLDFGPQHQALLRAAGYVCAFSTEPDLCAWPGADAMAIGRIPAGNDGTSEPAYFRLSSSGAIRFARRRPRVGPITDDGSRAGVKP